MSDTKENGSKPNMLFEVLRLLTPAGVTISIFLMSLLINKVDKLDDKVFKHLTNDEIHVSRMQVISKAEFDMQSQFKDKEMRDFRELVAGLRQDIKDLKK